MKAQARYLQKLVEAAPKPPRHCKKCDVDISMLSCKGGRRYCPGCAKALRKEREARYIRRPEVRARARENDRRRYQSSPTMRAKYQNWLDRNPGKQQEYSQRQKQKIYTERGYQPHEKPCRDCGAPTGDGHLVYCQHCRELRSTANILKALAKGKQERDARRALMPARGCAICGRPILLPGSRNNKKYCSEECREEQQMLRRATIKALLDIMDGEEAHRSPQWNPYRNANRRAKERRREQLPHVRAKRAERQKRRQRERTQILKAARELGLL